MARKKKSKRNYGSFGIRLLPSGNYQASYRLPLDANGERKLKTFTGPTREEAEAKAEAYKQDVEIGIRTEEARQSFAELFETFVTNEGARRNWKPATYETYQSLGAPLVEILGNTMLEDIGVAHAERAIYGKTKSKARPMRRWILLGQVFRYAVKKRLMREHPLDYLDAPTDKPAKERRALTIAEAAAVIQASIGTEVEAPVKLMLATGLRSGEVRALEWSDLDRENMVLRINKTVFEVTSGLNDGKGIDVGPPKTPRSIRSVEISQAVLDDLDRHHMEQQIHAALNPVSQVKMMGEVVRDPESDLMFPDRAGKLWRSGYFGREFKKVLKKAEIENPGEVTPHCLRHTHASLSIANGQDLFYLSRRLGHQSVSTTADRYSHMYKNQQTAAATVIDSLLGEETNG